MQTLVVTLQLYVPQLVGSQAIGVGGTHTLLVHTDPATTQSSAVAHASIQAVLSWLQVYVAHEEQSNNGVGATHLFEVHDDPATTQSDDVAHLV